MNASPARRRWFQLHLSTVILITLIAGGILWANSIWKYTGEDVIDSYFYPGTTLSAWETVHHEGLGWPVPFLRRDFSTALKKYYRAKVELSCLIVDAFMALLTLALSAMLFEIICRRRKQVARE